MNLPDKLIPLYHKLYESLTHFSQNEVELFGIFESQAKEVFVLQLIDSIRRVQYIPAIAARGVSIERTNPYNDAFDPLRAAIYYKLNGNVDEAFWLVFLFTHFGKSPQTGWKLCRDIYGGLDSGYVWTWAQVCGDFKEFDDWFKQVNPILTTNSRQRKFGNHRKYESLKYDANRSLIKVFQSYIDWIGRSYSHEAKFQEALHIGDYDPYFTFEHLYKSMSAVISFGRTAKFDYLTMVGKLGLAKIYPPKTYMCGATGPVRGALRLLGGPYNEATSHEQLEEILDRLGNYLDLGNFAKQILEDALCNWQKNTTNYVYFSG